LYAPALTGVFGSFTSVITNDMINKEGQMLKSELFELIANGENSGVEFKRDDLRPEQLAKEIVALANLQGGSILIGVEDDESISGIQRQDLETWVMDTVIAHYVHPMLLPFYQTIIIDGDKRVAVITIPQGTAKPYVLRHKDREEIYIRLSSTSRLATREQQMFCGIIIILMPGGWGYEPR
jgi:ATP-dependent DNA helicase RecG